MKTNIFSYCRIKCNRLSGARIADTAIGVRMQQEKMLLNVQTTMFRLNQYAGNLIGSARMGTGRLVKGNEMLSVGLHYRMSAF